MKALKNIISITFFSLAVIMLVYNIAYAVCGVVKVCNEYEFLSEAPRTSGLDSFEVGLNSGVKSFFGIILSTISFVTSNEKIKRVSATFVTIFSMLLIAGVAFMMVM